MEFLESTLEMILFKFRDKVTGKGLPFEYDILMRQVDLGSYGRCDLVGIKAFTSVAGVRSIDITIYELKKELIDYSSLGQVCRYITGFKELISRNNSVRTTISVKGVLIGRKVQGNGDFCFLLNTMPQVSAYTYNYGIDGLIFHRELGYRIKDATLPNINNSMLRSIIRHSQANLEDLPF